MAEKKVLLLLTSADKDYIPHLKPLLAGVAAYFAYDVDDDKGQIEYACREQGFGYVISTSKAILNKVVGMAKSQNIGNWEGSLWHSNGITYLFISPLKQFFTVTYGKFLAERFISKIIAPQKWRKTPAFTFEIATVDNVATLYKEFQERSVLIATDIETTSFDRQDEGDKYQDTEKETVIDCICYTGLFTNGTIHTIVLPIRYAQAHEQDYFVTWMRKFNLLEQPKVLQNGPYDCSHLLATYHSPLTNYLFDTQSLFHSWYSELPKSLDCIVAFTVHNSYYWKDMADVGGPIGRMEYNARDGWATMCAVIELLTQMPPWALNNYYIKFPLFVPCIYCNLEGLLIDEEVRLKKIEHYKNIYLTNVARLKFIIHPDFNPGSYKHVISLMHLYGATDLDSSEEKYLKQFALRHPRNAFFVKLILDAREAAKILSTYLKPKDFSTALKEKKEIPYLTKKGRMLYALSPDLTDTGRLGCRESVFWIGAQIQNQTELVKEMEVADPGWEMFEADNQTSESFCTGYSSGDPALLDTLLSGRDFHAINAERFFGIAYDEIVVRDEFGGWKTINKVIRDLSKRTNHGATYDMMWYTLLFTMGEENVDKAKALLKLPSFYNRKQTCIFLLAAFDKAYPVVRSGWYDAITDIVMATQVLVSPLNWTRYCFGNPKKSKREKDSLIAHVSQNMSVGIINEGFKDIFWKVMHVNENYKNLRLAAQVHDSILGQVRIGHRHLLKDVYNCLYRPTQVKDLVKGVERTMSIPVTFKIGPNWGALKTIDVKAL